jgi:hypothetical protein
VAVGIWLQPGSTDALTLGRLRNRGAEIYKSERLHMKVYWSSRRGCVVCSANASGSALGGGIQKEIGVSLPPKVVDIQRLWAYAKPRLIKKGDLQRLSVLAETVPRNNTTRSAEQPPDFVEWYNFAGRRAWKLGWWDTEDAEFAEAAVKTAREFYGVKQPYNMLQVKKQHARSGDWRLTFKLPGVTNLEWINVDFVVKQRKSEAAFVKGFSISSNSGQRAQGISAAVYNHKQISEGFQKIRKRLWSETDRTNPFNEATAGAFAQDIEADIVAWAKGNQPLSNYPFR